MGHDRWGAGFFPFVGFSLAFVVVEGYTREQDEFVAFISGGRRANLTRGYKCFRVNISSGCIRRGPGLI